jgi:hypothetical protein
MWTKGGCLLGWGPPQAEVSLDKVTKWDKVTWWETKSFFLTHLGVSCENTVRIHQHTHRCNQLCSKGLLHHFSCSLGTLGDSPWLLQTGRRKLHTLRLSVEKVSKETITTQCLGCSPCFTECTGAKHSALKLVIWSLPMKCSSILVSKIILTELSFNGQRE